MPAQLAPTLCPKVLSKLTLDGAASDGVGILQRLQDEIRERAHNIWLETGNPDSEANWKAAEKDVLILVHEAEMKLVRDLESNGATQGSNLEKKDVDEKRSVQEELIKIREEEAQKLKEEIASVKRAREEELTKRQKEEERIKELQSTLDAKSASLAKMQEARQLEQKEKNEKVSTLQGALEDSEKEVSRLTAELDKKKQEMEDAELNLKKLKGENAARGKEIEDLKKQLKELEEAQSKREKERALEQEQAKSKLPPAEKNLSQERALDQQQVKAKLQHAQNNLSQDDKKRLDAVLKNNFVEVDYEHSTFKLKENIKFEHIHHGDEPKPIFTNKQKTKAVLQDVAALLKIFKTAQVVIEGHTKTPDEKLDDWSQTLAENRAKEVMKEIVANSVEKSRLSAIGKPGRKGSQIQQVLIRVVEL